MEKQNYFYDNAKAYIKIEGVEKKDYDSKDNEIDIDSFVLKEDLCKLYDLEITITELDNIFTYDNITKKDLLILKKVTLTIEIHGITNNSKKNILQKRIISGIIVDYCFHTRKDTQYDPPTTYLVLKVKPNLEKMNLESKKFIFTEKTVENNTFKNILETVLKRNGKKLNTDYKINYVNQDIASQKHPFITQYKETDLEFFIRTLQENKLYFYLSYNDENGKEMLFIGEDEKLITKEDNDVFTVSHDFFTISDMSEIHYPIFHSHTSHEELIPHLQLPKPETPLFSAHLRKILFPGKQIKIKKLFKNEPEVEMIVVSTTTILRQPTSTDERIKLKSEISHEIVFHPKKFGLCELKSIKKPRVYSSQYALVVGNDGADSSSQKNAKVAIQLFWDKKANASFLPPLKDPFKHPYPVLKTTINVRVAQLFGGVNGSDGKANCGMWVLPRIGQKVIVHFLNGDTNFPIITGVVYDEHNFSTYKDKETDTGKTHFSIKTATSPYKKEDGKTGHELTFKDENGKQEVYLSSSKKLKIDVSENEEHRIKNHLNTIVEVGNISTTIKKGNQITVLEEGDYSLKVKKGQLHITVLGGNVRVDTDQDIVFNAKNIQMTAENQFKISAKTIKQEADGVVEIEASGNTIVKGAEVLIN